MVVLWEQTYHNQPLSWNPSVHRQEQWSKNYFTKRSTEASVRQTCRTTTTKAPPGSYVYAKPPPSSTAEAWIPGQVLDSAGPRSYSIKTGSRVIRRNRTQIRRAPPSCTSLPTTQFKQESVLPDQLVLNELTVRTPHSCVKPDRTVSPGATQYPVIPPTGSISPTELSAISPAWPSAITSDRDPAPPRS